MLTNLNQAIDELRRSHNLTLDYSNQLDQRGSPVAHGSDAAYDASLASLISQAQVLINSQVLRLTNFLASDKSSH